MWCHQVFFLVLIIVRLSLLKAGIVPRNPCPNFFSYEFERTHFYGNITIPNIRTKFINLDVQLSQETPNNSGFKGNIALAKSEFEILQGVPLVYRIDFPRDDEVPALLKITLNGKVICNGFQFYSQKYPTLDLHHNFSLNLIDDRPKKSSDSIYFPKSADVEIYNQPKLPLQSEFDGNDQAATVIIIPPSSSSRSDFSRQKVIIVNDGANEEPPVVEPRSGGNHYSNELPVSTEMPKQVYNAATLPSKIPSRNSEPAKATCGQQKVEFSPYVYGGTPIKRGQMPWIAAIYRKNIANLDFVCSGSLISATTVITAAHCVASNNKFAAHRFVVYLGRHDLDNYSEKGFEPKELRTYIVHPEYMSKNLSDADIALLVLETPITFTDYISPICLWHDTLGSDFVLNGATAYIAGWGADEKGNPISSIPKMVTAKIYSQEECLRIPGYGNILTPRTLCAGNKNGTGPCLGDSGAGLAVTYKNRWFLRAIVSGGLKTEKSCDRQKFVVYCDLLKHTDWINRNIVD